MTPNSENAMARLLLAMLNQKNLKDIDWNAVASDPLLLEPITNGHAARMRFTRFRDTVKGHAPQKRTRAEDKSRVTKSKKEQKPKNRSLAKSNSASSLASYAQVHQSPLIKQEQNQYFAQFSPASTSSPYLADTRDDFNRFLTPFSDDMPQQSVGFSPTSLEDLRMRNGFGPLMDSAPNLMVQQPPQDPIVVGQSPFLHTFDPQYDLASYKPAIGDAQSPGALDFNGPLSLADCNPEWMDDLNDQSF